MSMTAETALIAPNRQARRGQVHPPAAIVARSEGYDPSAGSLMDRGGASLQLLALCQARRERGAIAIRRGRPRPAAPRIPPGSAGEQDLEGLALPAGRGCRRGAVLRLPDRRAPRRRAGEWHAYDPEKVLLDPYAKEVFFPPEFDREAARRPGSNLGRAPLGVLPRRGRSSTRITTGRLGTSRTPRSSTRCTSAASRGVPTSGVAPETQGHLRRRDRQDPLPEGAGRHHGRAAPRAAVRPAGGQLLGLHDAELLRPARRLCGGRPATPATSSARWSAPCTRRTSRSSSTSSTTTRPRAARTGRPTASGGSTTPPTT